MFGMGWGELLVLAMVGLFVLGPERLPSAIRWVTGALSQVKGYVEAAQQQMNSPEFDEVRKPLAELREPLAELRSLDPRRTIRHALRGDPDTGTTNDSNTGTHPGGTGTHSNTGAPADSALAQHAGAEHPGARNPTQPTPVPAEPPAETP